MEKKKSVKKWLVLIGTHLLVAVLATVLTLFLSGLENFSKLDQLQYLIENNFVGEYDETAMLDAAAEAMLASTGDRWSYYIPASQYEKLMQNKQNSAYVGIGISITAREDGTGFDIVTVNPNGPALEAGIQPGDILIRAGGQDVAGLSSNEVSQLIQGEENTQVEIGVLRQETEYTFTLTRRSIPVIVAEGQMLEGNIGLVTINNFNEKCADETIAAIDSLVEQGAVALVFDVRGNPGGSAAELVEVLDHLLPEGPLFRSTETGGKEKVESSDADCIELPMAVIVNSESYSAAEFFAAALSEYDWATVVGQQTVGKSYFQYTYRLRDGSAVALSSGKYCTPKGVSLAEVGGLTPDVPVELDEESAKKLAYGQLDPSEDAQIQAAIESLGLS